MKPFLKRAARNLSTKPVIGRLVRIAIAFVRFPDLNHRHNVFVTHQLPQLLDTLSEINHRQSRLDAEQNSFVRTAPSTLRQLTLDIAQLRSALNALNRGQDLVAAPRAASVGTWGTESLRVNLGCGSSPLPGYVNVDRQPFPGVDAVVTDVADLPFKEGTVQEFFSSHFLEHFAPDRLRRSLLPSFLQLLAPGGRFRAIVSDMDAMVRQYAAGERSPEDLRDAIFGAPQPDSDPRRNIFTAKLLAQLLESAGFVNIKVLAEGRQNGMGYELEIVAEKRLAHP
jgi:predicted SAM-dependent methyltransferase